MIAVLSALWTSGKEVTSPQEGLADAFRVIASPRDEYVDVDFARWLSCKRCRKVLNWIAQRQGVAVADENLEHRGSPECFGSQRCLIFASGTLGVTDRRTVI